MEKKTLRNLVHTCIDEEKRSADFSRLSSVERHSTDRLEGTHGEEVGHHRAETRRQAGLRDETELQLGQADHVVALLPVP